MQQANMNVEHANESHEAPFGFDVLVDGKDLRWSQHQKAGKLFSASDLIKQTLFNYHVK